MYAGIEWIELRHSGVTVGADRFDEHRKGGLMMVVDSRKTILTLQGVTKALCDVHYVRPRRSVRRPRTPDDGPSRYESSRLPRTGQTASRATSVSRVFFGNMKANSPTSGWRVLWQGGLPVLF
jgi:hypothetical protein